MKEVEFYSLCDTDFHSFIEIKYSTKIIEFKS